MGFRRMAIAPLLPLTRSRRRRRQACQQQKKTECMYERRRREHGTATTASSDNRRIEFNEEYTESHIYISSLAWQVPLCRRFCFCCSNTRYGILFLCVPASARASQQACRTDLVMQASVLQGRGRFLRVIEAFPHSRIAFDIGSKRRWSVTHGYPLMKFRLASAGERKVHRLELGANTMSAARSMVTFSIVTSDFRMT